MSRPIFALFNRSLRLEARQTMPYIARLVLLGVILLELLIFYSASGRRGAPGLEFFTAVFYTNLVFITLAGIGYFATAITEEKEEMTLGLLRMTMLDPISILLGKSTVRLIGAAMLLAAQFPFTLLAITLGGIALNQVVAAYLTLLSWMIFMSSLGLFWSVICNKGGSASGAVMLSIMVFLALPLGSEIIGALEYHGTIRPGGAFAANAKWFFDATLELDPFKRGTEIMATGFLGPIVDAQFISNVVLGIILYLGAWRLFEIFTREQKDPSPARVLLARNVSGKRRIFSPGRPWRDALAWKDFHFMTGGWWAAVITYLVAGGVLGGIYWLTQKYGGRITFVDYAFGAQFAAWGLFVLQTLYVAGRVFADERTWQTWPNLVCLPISTGRLARSKMLGSLLSTFPLASVALALTIIGSFSREMEWEPIIIPVLFMVVTAWIFVLHLTMIISLYVKRGAGILTLGICFIGAQFLFAFVMIFSGLFLLGAWATLIGAGVGLLLASAGIHRLIAERLEVLAGM